MANKREFSVGRLFLQIALGTLLIVGGIWAITVSNGGDFGVLALTSVYNKIHNPPQYLYSILKISYGVIELIIGVFIVIEIFAGDILANFGKVLKIIIIVIWVASIILAHLIPGFGEFIINNNKLDLARCYDLALHLCALGGLFVLL